MSSPQERRDALADWLMYQHQVNLDLKGVQHEVFRTDERFQLFLDVKTQVHYTCGLYPGFCLTRNNEEDDDWDWEPSDDPSEKDGLERMQAAAKKYGLEVAWQDGNLGIKARGVSKTYSLVIIDNPDYATDSIPKVFTVQGVEQSFEGDHVDEVCCISFATEFLYI